MNRKYFSLLLALTFFSITLFGQAGYQIEVKLANYDQDLLMLGYHYGDKQYIKDSVSANADGKFIFQGDEALDAGVYLVVMPPDNQYFQLLINKQEQRFSVQTDAKSPNANMQIEGSSDNKLFYDYMAFLLKSR